MIIRKAKVSDVDRIVYLVNFYGNKGQMLQKSSYKVYTNLHSYIVAEDNGNVVGCSALSVLWKDLAEICSLAVDEKFLGKGIGRKLVEHCIEIARELGLPKVIALTYQDKFFERLGFSFVDKNQFPRKLWRECLECPKLEACDELAYMLEL